MDRMRMTNAEVARAIEATERQITRWRGGQQPRYSTVARLADVFGRDAAWFYTHHPVEEAA